MRGGGEENAQARVERQAHGGRWRQGERAEAARAACGAGWHLTLGGVALLVAGPGFLWSRARAIEGGGAPGHVRQSGRSARTPWSLAAASRRSASSVEECCPGSQDKKSVGSVRRCVLLS